MSVYKLIVNNIILSAFSVLSCLPGIHHDAVITEILLVLVPVIGASIEAVLMLERRMLVRVHLPDHNLFVFAGRSKMLGIVCECNGSDGLIMTDQSVNGSTFKQIKHFGRAIVAAGDHKIAQRMECDRVDSSRMNVVQLNELMVATIVDFDAILCESHCDQCTVRMEGNVSAMTVIVFAVGVNAVAADNVVQF